MTGRALPGAFDAAFVDGVDVVKADVRDLADAILTEHLGERGAAITAATNIELWPAAAASDGDEYLVSGTTPIETLTANSPPAGQRKRMRFLGATTLVNSSSLILFGGLDIATNAGEYCEVVSEGSNNCRLLWYWPPPVFKARSVLLAGLPAVGVTGFGRGLVYVSDLGGAGDFLMSDASKARRLGDHGVATAPADAAFTLQCLLDAPRQFVGTITADRAVTLSTTDAYNGATFDIARGAGAFNLNVGTGPLKAMPANSWATFVYQSAWKLLRYGTL